MTITALRIPEDYLRSVKDRIKLSELIGRDIKLKRAGREHGALCPFHVEKTPSFFVNDDKAHFWCFGCGAHGDHVSWLMRRKALTFHAAVEHLAGEKPQTSAQRFEDNLRQRSEEHLARSIYDYRLDDTQLGQRAMAQALWDHTESLKGTPAERYLRGRGITTRALPPSLRFADRAWIFSWEDGWQRTNFPALVASIQDSAGGVTAIQTTYLLADGSGKAPMRKQKLCFGPMCDGAIRLSEAGPILMIGEGIETGLAAQQMFSLPAWAAAGASRRMRIVLPEIVRTVIILKDNFGAPETERATEDTVRSVQEQGRAVVIEAPKPEYKDFCDQLVGKRHPGQLVIQDVLT